MSQVFFFCTLFDGNSTLIYKCKAESELCCGRGCCLAFPPPASIWSQWYFWMGIGIFVIFLVAIFFAMVTTVCRPQPAYTEGRSISSRYRIREILGFSRSRVANVAAVEAVCGPSGLIQPAVGANRPKTEQRNSAVPAIGPLRPPYPVRTTKQQLDPNPMTTGGLLFQEIV